MQRGKNVMARDRDVGFICITVAKLAVYMVVSGHGHHRRNNRRDWG